MRLSDGCEVIEVARFYIKFCSKAVEKIYGAAAEKSGEARLNTKDLPDHVLPDLRRVLAVCEKSEIIAFTDSVSFFIFNNVARYLVSSTPSRKPSHRTMSITPSVVGPAKT
jgi:hypothetical protein